MKVFLYIKLFFVSVFLFIRLFFLRALYFRELEKRLEKFGLDLSPFEEMVFISKQLRASKDDQSTS